MWDSEGFIARERVRDYQREVARALQVHNAVHGDINGAGSRGGWQAHRQRIGRSLVRAGTAIAGSPDRLVN